MPKASQTPSKAKSSTKAEAKPKILKPKSKKNAKPSREPTLILVLSPSISSTIPALSSLVPTVHAVPIIPTSKITTHAPEQPAKNISKSTKVKATPRKSIKKVPEAATPGDTVAKGSVSQGESMSVTTDQVPHLTFNWTEDEEDDEGEKEEEVMNSQEEHDAQNIANEEKKSENEGVSGDEKEKEENQSEEEEDSESEEEDQEKVSESERGDDESKEEEGNVSEESEGSMTIGNTVIAPSEEIGEETRAQEPGSLLTSFTGDEEVSSDKDDMPLSEAVDAQIIKESRSAKKPKKKVSIVEPIVEVDGEDESDSALPKSPNPIPLLQVPVGVIQERMCQLKLIDSQSLQKSAKWEDSCEH
ncbi:uncharacterized protein [Nicotiana tomentosiformis]|uniref:uncharacterized protein n=1 Tax=Nicotiana tomentosiformis TaxID=4098 RepID=UPI00388CEA4E